MKYVSAQVHFAEEWNEIHHLMIMESLGGDQLWIDRFMAQHAAVFYYWGPDCVLRLLPISGIRLLRNGGGERKAALPGASALSMSALDSP